MREQGWRTEAGEGTEGGRGHSLEYRANVALVTFYSLHLRGLRQSRPSAHVFFVVNLCVDVGREAWTRS